ncbi:hypothetical protein, partial [Actinomyces wuliandei]|uniref:hypothetical protein n=1 Tax=Actinomyces wuliandei TaxID=2057743 RepID=UPI001C59A142
TPGSQDTRGGQGSRGAGGGQDPSNSREVLEAVAAQVQAVLDRLAPAHTLPRQPEEGTLWHQLQTATIDAYVARAQEHGSRGGRAVIMAGPPGAGKS